MFSTLNGRVARIKREPAVAENRICFYCNNLQFVPPNLTAPDEKLDFTEHRTHIQGSPDDYFILIPARYLLRDEGQGPQDCRYCKFLHDTLNLFFVGPSMNWVKDSKDGWDGLVMAHIRTGFPLLLYCQESINRDCRWINLRAEIEVFCHDRSALSPRDLPSMHLSLPEQEHVVDRKQVSAFMDFTVQNCKLAPSPMASCYVVPNKLLHIDWNAQEIKLQHPPRLPPGAPGASATVAYATLSHCWSETDPNFPKLVASNLQSWLSGIRIEDLAPAIRDAAEVAYMNNLHYLWIESLCIVQDDEVDLQVQKPYVSAYFRDSAVTIVAASSTSPNDSFLFPDREDWITKQIDFTAPSGGTATINLRKRYSRQTSPLDAMDESLHHHDRHSFRRTGPLYRQQRCYQEALLGSRVISFTSAAIDVNCRRHVQCTKRFLLGYHRITVFKGLVCAYEDPAIQRKRLARLTLDNSLEEMLLSLKKREDTAMWLHAVMQYTARDVPVSHHLKLSGIAGLASMTSMSQQNVQYVAGLWMTNLHEGLLWEVRMRQGQTSGTRIMLPFESQKAPSFSWASVNAGVHYPDLYSGVFVPDATVKAAFTIKEDDSTFHDVNGGFVKLRGRVMRCEVSQLLSGPTAGAKGKLSTAHFSMKGRKNGVRVIKTKQVPFVADGSLLMVKNRKWSRDHSCKAAACPSRVCRATEQRKLVSEQVSCSWRSVTYLTRNHCGFRKKTPKHGQKKISGTAYVICLGWRSRWNVDPDLGRHEVKCFEGLVVTPSMRYPGAYERIGCIRNIPEAAYQVCEECTLTVV